MIIFFFYLESYVVGIICFCRQLRFVTQVVFMISRLFAASIISRLYSLFLYEEDRQE